MKSRIGISMNYRTTDSGVERAYIDSRYLDFLAEYEVLPCPIPPTEDTDKLGEYLDGVNGVLFTGGMDLDPGLWNEPMHPKTKLVHPRRQRYDLMLYELALFVMFPAADATGYPLPITIFVDLKPTSAILTLHICLLKVFCQEYLTCTPSTLLFIMSQYCDDNS